MGMTVVFTTNETMMKKSSQTSPDSVSKPRLQQTLFQATGQGNPDVTKHVGADDDAVLGA